MTHFPYIFLDLSGLELWIEMFEDFPGSPGIKTLHFHSWGCGF